MWRRTIDCLGRSVAVSSPLPELAPHLAAVLRTYAETTRPADLTYVLEQGEWPHVVRDGTVICSNKTPLDLVPAFEVDLYRQVINAAEGLVLHSSGLVGASGTALVFAGRSGAGKSTLARALLAKGFRYLSEECVSLLANQRCRGLARSLHVGDAAVPVPEGYTSYDYLRRGHGIHELRLFHPPEHVIWRPEPRTAAVVAIDHHPQANGKLVPLTGGAALAALWPTVFRRDADALDRVGAGIDGVPVFQLQTSTPEQAIERALSLAQDLGV